MSATVVALDEFAIGLAKRHTRAPKRAARLPDGRALARQLESMLETARRSVATLYAEDRAQLVGLDWLDENHHILQEAIEQIRGNLPRSFIRKLPTVDDLGAGTALRAGCIAEEVVAYGDLPLDLSWLKRFLRVYQTETELDLGELWALPTLLRASVISLLCDAIQRADSMSGTAEMEQAFEDADGVISGVILSLRTVAATDWLRFVEDISLIEDVLNTDPGGSYPNMDAESRNRYRACVENLARKFRQTERTVAETAVSLAQTASPGGPPRHRHVGYYLLDEGRDDLKCELSRWHFHVPPFRDKWRSWPYLLTIITATAVALLLVDLALRQIMLGSLARSTFLVLSIVPVLTVWTETLNWLATQCVKPRTLAKLDFSAGVPAQFSTIVAIPCLLHDTDEAERLLHALEINYLGNEDPSIQLALLSDFADADSADLSSDSDILNYAVSGVEKLNARHGRNDVKPFALLHRRRLWNENAGRWMGWERKRGKIDELNCWLLGEEKTSFTHTVGDLAALRRAKFVITLDADNQLLPGTARSLIGTIAHPLNRAQIDDETGEIVSGYSVIQPRVDIHPASSNRTPYSRLMSGNTGIDLYHLAVSETYQDLFGQGIYAGKGIYDVAAFAACIAGLVPCNAVLSHDLLEGILSRAALASDIVVLENASPNLAAELRRQHRWIRGDWQLLPWLIPVHGSRRQRRSVDVLGRWKLFDNLRRSLVPPSLLLMYPVGWVLFPIHAGTWTIIVSAVPALRILLSFLGELRLISFRWGTMRSTMIRIAGTVLRQAGQYGVNFAMLPIMAWTALDAIGRTLARVLVTGRNMLEWTPSAHSEHAVPESNLLAGYRRGIAAPVAGLAALTLAGAVTIWNPIVILVGAIWCCAPMFAWVLARERRRATPLSASDTDDLRLLARRTWQFYERFVGPETFWLPPDNYQEAPKHALAERTSPTNIGLFLLAAVSAHELGYVSAGGLLTRIDGATATMRRMKRFRGHLYNWYSTRDLSVLAPDYVSTVDSGNLLAALLICRSTLLEMGQMALGHVRAASAVGDLLANIKDAVIAESNGDKHNVLQVVEVLDEMQHLVAETRNHPAGWAETLAAIRKHLCADLDRAMLTAAEQNGSNWDAGKISSLRTWVIQLRTESDVLHAELNDILTFMQRIHGGQSNLTDIKVPATIDDLRNLIRQGDRQQRAIGNGSDAAGAHDSKFLEARRDFSDLLSVRDQLVTRIDRIIAETDFTFLFDRTRKLFHVGYNNTTGQLDPSYYDLLASEARIASLVAIAMGDVPLSHWVHLGRPLRRVGGMRAVLSWSATAFEYLMPRLFMESPAHGLLDVSCRAIIHEQRKLTRRNKLPWGISESGYFELDAAGNYKYHAFGVESLAIRRISRPRFVISPYSSILALAFEPVAVVENLRKLRAHRCWGRYGMYDALDFGENYDRQSPPRIVRSFMAHHQGMIMAAVSNAICDDVLVRRFHSNAEIRTVEHLLYESLPKRAQDRIIRHQPPVRQRRVALMTAEHVRIPRRRLDRFVNVVGNGHLTVRTTARASGDIIWNGKSITRWQPRTQGPGGGDKIILSDFDNDSVHTLGMTTDDTHNAPDAWCAPHETELHQRFGTMFARLTVAVAPYSDVVFKRVILTNESARQRNVGLTHYAEPVLADAAEDRRHPAFNKLFIANERRGDSQALVFSRRLRGSNEAGHCCAVSAIVSGGREAAIRMTTSKRRFFGDDRGFSRPDFLTTKDAASDEDAHDSLDPAAVISASFVIPAGATVQVCFVTSVATELVQALELLEHFRSLERANFAMDQSRRRVAADLTDLSVDSRTVADLLAIYSDILWPQPFSPQLLRGLTDLYGIRGTLWGRGISGDHPICMASCRRTADKDLAENLLILQTYLGRRGVTIDVILANESPSSYTEPIRDKLEELVHGYRDPHAKGKAFILPMNSLAPSERAAINVAAAVHLDADRTRFTSTLRRELTAGQTLPGFVPTRAVRRPIVAEEQERETSSLEFDNGYGGVDPDNGDYVIRVSPSSQTPAPWINVMANTQFGCIVSERGAATTWYGNSSEHRITPWYNDPVEDRCGEAVYIRDEETGEVWSPMPWPMPADGNYLVRHGAGYSRFEHESHSLAQCVECFVDCDDPVKILKLRLRNHESRTRRVTLCFYTEWVLGNHYEDNSLFVVPELSEDGQVMTGHNTLPRFGGERTVFVTSPSPLHGYATDRREFLGAATDLSQPAALSRIGLSGSVAAGGESCCAYQIHADLEHDNDIELSFVLGAAPTRQAALMLASKYRTQSLINDRFATTKSYWQNMLGRCRIRTPNRALDVLVNRWLLYQNMTCRLWGRTAFYQSAGGFGFRDQLQDSLGAINTMPELARRQILRACAMQFPEGDVLHWWHDGPTRGVRSRCSDDLLWLPYAVSEYLRVTGDETLLQQPVHYLAGEPLHPDELERYTEYESDDLVEDVYAHCNRAIDASGVTGTHGLPLIGTGDWNDGLSRVGIAGRGESVWLGWFLADINTRFAEIARGREETARAAELQTRCDRLVSSLEDCAWDGDWYLRAYYDDGSTLGSKTDTECKIDLNAQTWPIITGRAESDRASRALDAVAGRLVDPGMQLIRLLAPPFERTLKDPGYIRGYPPGVRENGGQYTHASTWAIWAAVKMKRPDLAMQWLDFLNPLLRVTDKHAAKRYRAEPYVLAGDVYAVAPRAGRAGWTWYTGSAAWLYRIVLEQVLGFQISNGRVNIAPCVPEDWPGYEITYQFGATRYRLELSDPASIAKFGPVFHVDGSDVDSLQLLDDSGEHHIAITPASGSHWQTGDSDSTESAHTEEIN